MTKDALRKELRRRRWTQLQAAKAIGVSRHAIYSWLTGRSPVPLWAELSLTRIPITFAEETK